MVKGKKFAARLKKGAGGMLEYTVSIIGLAYMVILLSGLMALQISRNDIEDAANLISRDVIVCGSLEEAQELAEKEAKVLLLDSYFVDVESVEASVSFVPGSGTEWEKGNYVYVSISAHVSSTEPLTSGTKYATAMAMIERS